MTTTMTPKLVSAVFRPLPPEEARKPGPARSKDDRKRVRLRSALAAPPAGDTGAARRDEG